MKFAAQMNTLRAYCGTQRDLLDTLKKVADMGFDGVELEYGMLKVADQENLASHLETIGLEVASIRNPFARTEFGMEDMIRQAKILKCQNVGIGTMTTAQFNQGAAGYDRYFAQLDKIIRRFRKEGLRPVYSLRNHEFVRQNGRWIFDKLLEANESAGLFFETDVLPLTRAAVDPHRIFARLAGRMPVCRLTDQKIRENEMYFFFPEREECPLGEGLFDLALWADAAGNAGAEWFVLGQNLCDRVNFMTLAASLIGTTSLIFNAKGNPIGQALMVVFSLIYGVISYTFSYFGEMITYLGMTGPMALFALISWLRNPYNGNRAEVAVNRLENKELALMYVLTALVTWGFYFILDHFDTANMIPSTVSVTTSFIAVYLTFRRSPYFALAYAANDVVLIVLWTLAAVEDISYLSVIICFVLFLVNDLYGFVSWKRMEKRQMATL